MSEFDQSTIAAISALTRSAKPFEISTVTHNGVSALVGALALSDGAYAPVDMKPIIDKFRAAPERKEGTSTALSLRSFIDLCDRHSDEGSALFADIVSDSPKIIAVFDYHHAKNFNSDGDAIPGAARYGKHRSSYSWPISKEWKAWQARDGVQMDQSTFANWLESHIPELSSPTEAEKARFEAELQTSFGTPAKVIEVSRSLSIVATSKVGNTVTLANGTMQIQFEETHSDGSGKPVQVPGLFMVAIPLFVGGEDVRIPVRLRYQKKEAALVWSFHLYRPEHFVHEALTADLATAQMDTGLPLYEGAPE